MATITIQKNEFEQFVPVATTPANQPSVFNSVSKGFGNAFDTLCNTILGLNYDSLPDAVKTVCKRYVSISAFINAFRQLDVVLTATGFGIVNNQNVAPASKERVDALLTDLWRELDKCEEQLLILLTRTEGWSGTRQAKICISNLYWRRSDMEAWLGIANPTRDERLKIRQQVDAVEVKLAEKISWEQREKLLVAMRSNSLTELEQQLVDKAMQFISASIKQQLEQAAYLLRKIVDFLNDNVDEFQEYKNSQEYEINNNRGYQNAKQDTAYFFK